MSKLNVDLKLGDVLIIGDVEVRLQFKKGQAARLEVIADKSIEIKHRRMSASDSATETQAHGKHTL